MTAFHLAVVPIGKIDAADVEAALARVSRVLRSAIELRDALPVPPGVEDRERGQFRAATLMTRLAADTARLGPGRLVGADAAASAPPAAAGRATALLFVTDVDLFTAKSDGVFAALSRPENVGVVSLRRLREAFYRRPADPAKQRARLVKELLRVAARLRGLPECSDPQCALAPSRSVPDVETKNEGFCRSCAQRLFQGTIQI